MHIYALHAMKFGDAGAELISSWSKSGFFINSDEEELFALKQGSVLLSIQRFTVGLSGPFPVNDFPNVKCLVHAFQLEDHSLKDPRFGGIAHTLLIIYFPVIHEQEILSRRTQLEHTLLKLTIGKRNVTEITKDFLKMVKVEIHDVITRMEQVILLANTELVLSKIGDLRWSFFATGGANYQEITKQLYLILFDKLDSFQRTSQSGITTSSSIKAFDNRLQLEITVLSNYNVIGTVSDACKSEAWKKSDAIFFLLPFSYSLENKTASIVNMLDHCDEQTPLVVMSEKIEDLDSSIDPISGSSLLSFTYIKKQLIREKTAPLLVLSGTIDQKILFEGLEWALDQVAKKEGLQLVPFERQSKTS
ncbi:MAG: hypothetical protein ACXAEU_09555 [Candidatus Hodarchaeales archaeon]|jgi:hypothetical protein